ncbi:AGCS family alanine or glycine:cation symporter [Methylohalomonas lacus]|uniref:AGCS family alanine or glycine:cation symporter n=1 Tax=Methylohalomonas lacus TaxID=398773 RepID=A0AAE3L0V4_9GAMM|nr:sodium:alanine symporter family protein [Methylohalomonas lacus]MCS3903144.1 AGCS family alanine or glycine:cation symporter [Methylohalomonas lacus]
MQSVETVLAAISDFIWGPPLITLIVGGGLFFLIYSQGLPYRYLGHALRILRGDYDRSDDPGDISHFQALSAALSGTLGLGNIAGVALAISMGGPGAVFWMWITALVGVATKFFTCTLAIMYRGMDSRGRLQGGPMYIIREGLGRRWRGLAIFFCLAGLIGTLPMFQINQLTEALREAVLMPQGIIDAQQADAFNFLFGVIIAMLVAAVIFGGIERVGYVAARLVPVMVLIYLVTALAILLQQHERIPAMIRLIFSDAFSGQAAAGGLLGVMIVGVRQGAFSNEAGLGTEVMAHGAARTREPVREGLVAMLGPVIDTLVVCTCTALVILSTGVWQRGEDVSGAALTTAAYAEALGTAGTWLILGLVVLFSLSTMFSYWYYGSKCLGYLIGAEHQHWYRYFYVVFIVIGAMVSVEVMIYLMTTGFGLMALPTMLASMVLAPKVMAAARDYFRRLRQADSGRGT